MKGKYTGLFVIAKRDRPIEQEILSLNIKLYVKYSLHLLIYS